MQPLTVAGELMLDTPATRPCTHRRVHHDHGTIGRYAQDKCRCAACSEAKHDYDRNRKRQIAYGRWNAFADAGPVREHVRSLMRFGIGWRTVADHAGVSHETVKRLLYGKPTRGQPPTRRMLPRTADALLAVSFGRHRAPETPDLFTKEVPDGP